MTDPCENCGTPVTVDELVGAIPTGPTTVSRVETPLGSLTCRTTPVKPHPRLYESEPAHFTASGGVTVEGAFLTEHTPFRCHSARRHRQETR